LCLRLISQYGESDIGILFTFFFNILRLNVGESFAIRPDEPHAYIEGDIMESMVSSDNVVRGGLTPKFKDTKTLVEMLKYEFKEVNPNSGIKLVDEGGATVKEYKSGFDEFKVTHISLQGGAAHIFHSNSAAIAMVYGGPGTCSIEGLGEQQLEVFKPYMILPGQKAEMKGDGLSVFITSCDI